MGRLQPPNIAGLMGLVFVVAIGLTGLRTHPTLLWASAAFSYDARRISRRSFSPSIASDGGGRKVAAGYAACGWGYFLLSLAPGFDTSIGLYLITTPLIEWFYRHSIPDPFSFTRIAHSLFSIASGLAGGLFAWWLTPRTDPVRSITSTTAQP